SPVQLSSVPRMAKLIPTSFNIFTKARVVFFARSSKLPAQPTQNSTSGFLPSAVNSAIVFTFKFSVDIAIKSFFYSVLTLPNWLYRFVQTAKGLHCSQHL